MLFYVCSCSGYAKYMFSFSHSLSIRLEFGLASQANIKEHEEELVFREIVGLNSLNK